MQKQGSESPKQSDKQLTPILKKCLKCKIELSVDSFSKNKLRKDGLSCYCKECNNAIRKIQYRKCRELGTYNRDAANKHAKTWRDKNKSKIRKDYTKWFLEKRRTDPNFKMKTILRNRVCSVLKRIKAGKNISTMKLLGCDVGEFVLYIQALFAEGMTWENHGLYGWHIDHIEPCAAFDLTDVEQQKKCFHYTNLQPLWAEDNLKKGDRI